MDVFSHGLWGWAFLNKEKWYLAMFFGILPDIISFGPHLLYMFFNGGLKAGKPDIAAIPKYVFTIYNVMHSIIVVALVFAIIFLLTKKVYIFMLAWPIHILMDIPTHTKEFFPTKFLFPLSGFYIDGFSWGQWWFMAINYSLLLIVYAVIFYKSRI